MQKSYFVINDTRYDNHHGGLRVMANLHLAMERRGWRCTGSLPVSSSVHHLKGYDAAIADTDLVLVNGEGSLHHDSRNASRLFAVLSALPKQCPMVLINSLWQDNDPNRWTPLLSDFSAVYVRDRYSQAQIQAMGINADYAPDLTFYNYPDYSRTQRNRYMCTDSVLRDWNEHAYKLCASDPDLDFRTLRTRHARYSRGARDYGRKIKYVVYPWLFEHLKVNVPVRYKILSTATDDSDQFLRSLSGYQGWCTARYHALCFAFQQQMPMLAVPSNSHKSEALLEEAGLPHDLFMLKGGEAIDIKSQLQKVIANYGDYANRIVTFNEAALGSIERMFDHVVSLGG